MIAPHWRLHGPGRARPWSRIARVADVAGPAHVATIRRLWRIGPYGVYVLRYRPGHVDGVR